MLLIQWNEAIAFINCIYFAIFIGFSIFNLKKNGGLGARNLIFWARLIVTLFAIINISGKGICKKCV